MPQKLNPNDYLILRFRTLGGENASALLVTMEAAFEHTERFSLFYDNICEFDITVSGDVAKPGTGRIESPYVDSEGFYQVSFQLPSQLVPGNYRLRKFHATFDDMTGGPFRGPEMIISISGEATPHTPLEQRNASEMNFIEQSATS